MPGVHTDLPPPHHPDVQNDASMNEQKKFPSSVDVARRAGVSQSAVSRTFAPNGSVSEKTRAKVLAAAEELGYRPSVIPRIMLTHRSFLVAIAIGGMYNPFNSSVLETFARKLQAIGYQVMLVQVEHGESLESVMPRLAGYRVDAIFVARGVLDDQSAAALAEFRIPIVAFHTPLRNEWVSSVCWDNLDAGRQIAELFHKRGLRQGAFIGGPPQVTSGMERWRGFRIRLLELGHPEPVMLHAPFTYEGGVEATERLLSRPLHVDAVFCSNDLAAIGCMDTLRERGLNIPEDVMVAGFDDIPEASWKGNDLTTFGQSDVSLVDASLAILSDVVEAMQHFSGIIVTVPVRLIERGSTAPRHGGRH